MFAYCTERLHLSEAEAYRRITVARAARTHGVLLGMLRDGRLHLSGIAMLAPLLTPENRGALLARATHRPKRQIQELVAELSPRPDAPSFMRKQPEEGKPPLRTAPQGQVRVRDAALELVPGRVGAPATASTISPDSSETPSIATGLSRTAVVEPLSPARYKVQFAASAELRDKLERLSALMRSEVPGGDLAAVIDLAEHDYGRAVIDRHRRLEKETPA